MYVPYIVHGELSLNKKIEFTQRNFWNNFHYNDLLSFQEGKGVIWPKNWKPATVGTIVLHHGYSIIGYTENSLSLLENVCFVEVSSRPALA